MAKTQSSPTSMTRAGLIPNGSGRIIEPLASRCAKFRFKPLPEEVMKGRILHICKEEGINLDSEALSTLSTISQGDLRRAITYLQVFIACGFDKSGVEDSYCKPKPGMWHAGMLLRSTSILALLLIWIKAVRISFYVGDAAGRENDHSDADIKFAQAKFVSNAQLVRKEGVVSNTQHMGNKDSKSNAQYVRNEAIMPNAKQDARHESIMFNAQKEIR